MHANSSYLVNLPQFQGPFELLYHLIRRSQLDIRQISMAVITRQYLDYLKQMQELNLEITSEFLVMAATLLRLKSKALLPLLYLSDEDEDSEDFLQIDSQEELALRLEAYQALTQTVRQMEKDESEQRQYFFRREQGFKLVPIMSRTTPIINLEHEAFFQVLTVLRQQASAVEPLQYVKPEHFSVRRWTKLLLGKIRESVGGIEFSSVIKGLPRRDIAATFFTLTELVRRRKVIVYQDIPFGPLLIMDKEKTDE